MLPWFIPAPTPAPTIIEDIYEVESLDDILILQIRVDDNGVSILRETANIDDDDDDDDDARLYYSNHPAVFFSQIKLMSRLTSLTVINSSSSEVQLPNDMFQGTSVRTVILDRVQTDLRQLLMPLEYSLLTLSLVSMNVNSLDNVQSRSLLQLELWDCTYTDDEAMRLSLLPALQSIIIEGGDIGILPDIVECYSLINVSMKYCNMDGTDFELLVWNELTNLVELVVEDCRVHGRLDKSIGSLPSLRVLNLRQNNLTGQLPDKMAQLNRLQYLDLSNNQFTGDLQPLISTLNLEYLDISNNAFEGRIDPGLILNHHRLYRIIAHNNRLTSIPNVVSSSPSGLVITADSNIEYSPLYWDREIRNGVADFINI